jgi:uncharacterized PurR-regulated membrane protein YhhQ (DUF165 family)
MYHLVSHGASAIYLLCDLYYHLSRRMAGVQRVGHIFNLFIARLSIASFMAYLLDQILDVHVFKLPRQGTTWWVALCGINAS